MELPLIFLPGLSPFNILRQKCTFESLCFWLFLTDFTVGPDDLKLWLFKPCTVCLSRKVKQSARKMLFKIKTKIYKLGQRWRTDKVDSSQMTFFRETRKFWRNELERKYVWETRDCLLVMRHFEKSHRILLTSVKEEYPKNMRIKVIKSKKNM